MKNLDLDTLEAKAKAATPGPWTVHPKYKDEVTDGERSLAQGLHPCAMADYNAAHIAAFDPPTALALIAQIRELEAALNDTEALAESWMRDYDRLKEQYEPMIVVESKGSNDAR